LAELELSAESNPAEAQSPMRAKPPALKARLNPVMSADRCTMG
jgi:hypothetical protein